MKAVLFLISFALLSWLTFLANNDWICRLDGLSLGIVLAVAALIIRETFLLLIVLVLLKIDSTISIAFKLNRFLAKATSRQL